MYVCTTNPSKSNKENTLFSTLKNNVNNNRFKSTTAFEENVVVENGGWSSSERRGQKPS